MSPVQEESLMFISEPDAHFIHSFISSHIMYNAFIEYLLLLRHHVDVGHLKAVNRALTLSLQSYYLATKRKKSKYNCIIDEVIEVDYLHQGSEFEFMSTISTTFVVTSSLSCMNRELVLT